MSSYAGDSNVKRIVRDHVWGDVHRLAVLASTGASELPQPPWPDLGRCLALSGPDGADWKCGRSWGLHMIVCDRDAQAIADAKGRGIDAVHGDVVEVARAGLLAFKQRWRAIYLDFCGPLSGETMKTIRDVAPLVRGDGGALVVTVLKGREYGDTLVPGAGNRRTRRAQRANMARGLEAMRHMAELEPDAQVGSGVVLHPTIKGNTSQESILGRAAVVLHQAAMAGRGDPGEWWIGAVRNYRGHRSPMLTVMLIRGLESRLSGTPRRGGITLLCSRHERYFPVIAYRQQRDNLRDVAIESARGGHAENAADRFNLEPGTVRAWMAHDTRGTYRRDA